MDAGQRRLRGRLSEKTCRDLPAPPNSRETLTYNVYASKGRHYKRRNLQAAARIIAAFAREHPISSSVSRSNADTYMNPFFHSEPHAGDLRLQPGMLKQFRHWLAGTGPYAGKPEPGVPDLSRYRRPHPLTLRDVNKLAGKHWSSWSEVDPPRSFPGSPYQPAAPGQAVIWDNLWYQEWQVFRQHIIALHYDDLSQWVHEAGISKDRIFSAEDSSAPIRAVAVRPAHHPAADRTTIRRASRSKARSQARAISGQYSMATTAENRTQMEGPHSLFAAYSRMDPGWRWSRRTRPISRRQWSSRAMRSPITLFATCSTSTRRKSR